MPKNPKDLLSSREILSLEDNGEGTFNAYYRNRYKLSGCITTQHARCFFPTDLGKADIPVKSRWKTMAHGMVPADMCMWFFPNAHSLWGHVVNHCFLSAPKITSMDMFKFLFIVQSDMAFVHNVGDTYRKLFGKRENESIFRAGIGFIMQCYFAPTQTHSLFPAFIHAATITMKQTIACMDWPDPAIVHPDFRWYLVPGRNRVRRSAKQTRRRAKLLQRVSNEE